MYAKLSVQLKWRLDPAGVQLNGSLVAMGGIVVDRSECVKLANRWPVTVRAHAGCLPRLFDVHARLSHDLFLLLMAYLDRKVSQLDSKYLGKGKRWIQFSTHCKYVTR
jgi:hypothetical protein